MAERMITVFGGTGFLGRRVVRRLRERGVAVRVATRHPERAARLDAQPIAADVTDDRSVADAVAGAHGVVNAVSLYVERGATTFQAVHVAAAARVADMARRAGVARLVHVSGIGADPASSSRYIRSRGAGEAAVQAGFPGATIMRSAVMVGPHDALLSTLAQLLRRLPVYPMFGRGDTKLQPVHVGDVAAAITRTVLSDDGAGLVYELGGPVIYRYQDLLRTVARHIGVRPILVPVPFPAWRALAAVAEQLPAPPLTRNQVELMEIDTVASPECPGFANLGIAPRPLEAALARLAERR